MSTLGNNLFGTYYAQQGLPYGYRRVEYLESAGTQYIDTNYRVASDSVICSFIFALTSEFSFSNSAMLFGSYDYKYFARYSVALPSNSSVRVPSDDAFQTVALPSAIVANQKHTISLSYAYVSFDGVSVGNGTYGYSAQSNKPIYLFGRSSDETVIITGGIKCFGNIIMEASRKARNFIPCVRLSDNKPGLYDLCGSICPLTNTPFYVNAGTGEFVIPT